MIKSTILQFLSS